MANGDESVCTRPAFGSGDTQDTIAESKANRRAQIDKCEKRQKTLTERHQAVADKESKEAKELEEDMQETTALLKALRATKRKSREDALDLT